MGAYLSSPIRDKVSEDDEHSHLKYGASAMQGWRMSQEDAHNCLPDYDPDTNTSLFGCYDGHGGAEVALYTAQKLPEFLKSMPLYMEGKLGEALEEGFLQFDASLVQEDVVQKLKELAQMDDEEDQQEEGEAAALYEEATMPLEELLERYGRGGIKKKLLEKDNIQSPAIRPKKEMGDEEKNDVKMNLETELMNGHKEGEEDGKGDVAKEGEGGEANDKVGKDGEGDAKTANEAEVKENEKKAKTQDKEIVKAETSEAKAKEEKDSNKLADSKVESSDSKVESSDSKVESSDSKVESSSSIDSTTVDSNSNGDKQINPKGTDNTTDTASSSKKQEGDSSDSKTDTKSMDSGVGSSSDAAPGVSSGSGGSSSTGGSCTSSVGGSSSSAGGGGPSSSAGGSGSSTSAGGSGPSSSAGGSGSSTSAGGSGLSTSAGGSGSSSSAGGSGSSSSDTGPCSSSKEEPQAGSSSGRVRNKRKGVIPEEGEDESSFDEDSEEEEEDSDSEEGETERPWASGSEDSDEEEEGGMMDDDDDDDEEGGSGIGSGEPGSDSGCTAVVALLRGRELYVANSGDSRCVVNRGGKAMDMSVDHKPEDDLEHERIKKAGGRVTMDGRVNGGLNMSRAIGDHCYKQNKEVPDREQMITSLPDVRQVRLEDDDSFMVLACDGIWNVMSSQDVVNFVDERLKGGATTLSAICEEMFDFCLAPDTMGDGTGCDNMTCIIVTLKHAALDAMGCHGKKRPASTSSADNETPSTDAGEDCQPSGKRQKIDEAAS